MRNKKSATSRAVVRSALLVGTSLAFCSSAALAQDDGRVSGIEDIVVTAQKREQNLQVVPISITALSADTLAANRIQDVRDLNAVAPNLTVRNGAGGNQTPNYSMRGILTGGTAPGTDKGISLYLDGVYIQNVQGSIMELADIERIEVLKGPQGTLFGRNATGGAISIITRNPTGEFGVKQEFTYGNYDQFRSRTRVDLPSLGPVSAAVTYMHSERRGDTRNYGAGTVWDLGPATFGEHGRRKSPKWLGGSNVESVAAALKFDFHPDLELTYKYDYAENHYTPEAMGLSYLAGNLETLYGLSPGRKTPVTRKRPKGVNNAYTTNGFTKSQGHNLTARFQINDQISIKNILAYRKGNIESTFQLDGLGGLRFFPGPPAPPGFSLPFAALLSDAEQFQKQWSNEFQINIDTDWFNLTAGYLHFEDRNRTGGFENWPNTYSAGPIPIGDGSSGNPYQLPRATGYRHSRVKVVSDAFFVQPEIHLTEQLDIVAGARITRDKKNGIEYSWNQRAVPDFTATSPISYNRSHVSFLAGINYRPTPDILTYAKYSTGYISGGQLATLTFAPETAKSWEAGIKADLFDRRFRTNLAVYRVKYGAIQYSTSGLITGYASSAPFAQAVVAVGDAKAWGFEWENTIIPVDGLTLTANLGYTNFKFDQDTILPGLAFQVGAPGYKEFGRPKWTGNFSAQYDTQEIASGGHLSFRADANFRSKFLLTSDLTPGEGPTAQEDPALRRAATSDFNWIVNGRIALKDMDIAGTKATVAVWGRNILDNKSISQFVHVGLGPLGNFGSAIYERARTYGLDVSFQF